MSQTLAQQLDALPAHQRALLYLLALQGRKTANDLHYSVNVLQLSNPSGKPLSAQEVGSLLGKELKDWRQANSLGHLLHEDRLAPVLLHFLHSQERQRWNPVLARMSNKGMVTWLALLNGAQELANTQLDSWYEQFHGPYPPRLLLQDRAGRELLAQLDDDIQAMLLLDSLLEHNFTLTDASAPYDYALSRLDDGLGDWPPLREQLAMQALWRGDEATLKRVYPNAEVPLSVSLLLLLQQGRYAEALAAYRDWLVFYRKQTRKRKVELPPDLNLLAIWTLLAPGDAALHPEIQPLIAYGRKQDYGYSYFALEALMQKLGGHKPLLPPFQRLQGGLDGLSLVLCVHWLDATCLPEWEEQLLLLRRQLQDSGYVWVAGELTALLNAQYGRNEDSGHAQRNLQPLLAIHQRQEAWQLALSALAQLKPGGAAVEKTASDTRLAWLLTANKHGIELEPREQKRSAKGQWSKGRAVALRRLHEEGADLAFLTEQDRRAIRHITLNRDYYYYGSSQYELNGYAALPELSGHPALFWADAPDVRIDVAMGQPALQLKTAKGRIELKLMPAGIDESSELVWDKETPTRLVVYPVNDEIRRIAAIVGKKLEVPESAKPQLVAAISAIAPLLPIHSDLPELAAHIDSVPADGKLYAHLLPLEEGLRLQILVRPLAEGGWYPPGKGMENLVGERDGKPVQAARSLKAEKAALQQALDACPALQAAESDGQEWQLAEPQDALEALSQLRALDAERLECVWPEGERMRLKGRRDLKSMSFSLQAQGDWFALNGEVKLDDGQVLQLRQLLQLLSASRGRFIRLGDNDWLALDDQLRRQLQQLALLGEPSGKDGLRLNALTAPLLAELAEEAGEFTGDKGWREHLARLESLQGWQPQVPSTLQAELRDYQREGYAWLSRLARWGVGACLADDMGLGKTVQTLALLLERAPGGPQLVVAPTSVAMNWLAETARFAPTLNVRAYHQQRDLSDLKPFDLVVVSYGLLQQEADSFTAQHWHSVALDEAQAIKNAHTKRSQAVMALQADFKLAASGTPVENHLGELWNLFRFLNPGLLGGKDKFEERFAGPIANGDAAARKALKTLLQPFILRRSKSQVLDELPARTEITHKVALSRDEQHWYEALRQQAVEKLDGLAAEESQPLQVLAEITRLRRFCCHPTLALPDSALAGSKLAAFAEILAELLENRHKALVFSQFVDHLAIVRRYLDEQGIAYQYLDGATPPKERQARVNAFQAGEGDVFLISLKAGGTGLNLTAADYVIHLDPWWNPAVEDQASDRAHRMGQQRPVTVYRLVAEGTIEEQIVALHAKKRDLADSLLEGGEMSAKLDADALLALLRGG